MPRVGIISDTHGLLRPEAMSFLSGSDFIVHAGDIGNASVLSQLAAVAPVTAVRGNNDKGPWANAVPEFVVLRVDNIVVYVLHDVAELHPIAGVFGAAGLLLAYVPEMFKEFRAASPQAQ